MNRDVSAAVWGSHLLVPALGFPEGQGADPVISRKADLGPLLPPPFCR